jgi:hypothetical protein
VHLLPYYEPISATAGVQKALKQPLVFEGGFRCLQPADAALPSFGGGPPDRTLLAAPMISIWSEATWGQLAGRPAFNPEARRRAGVARIGSPGPRLGERYPWPGRRIRTAMLLEFLRKTIKPTGPRCCPL